MLGRERLFLTLALSVMLASWWSLLLSECGIFSIGLLLAVLLGWSALAGFWLWRKGYRAAWWRGQFSWRPERKLDSWLAAVILGGSAVLFLLAPHETLVGSQDSGVYFNTGANIARSGAIIIQDPLLKTIGQAAKDPTIGPKVIPQVLQGVAKKEDRYLFARYLRLPGFFVRSNDDGLYNGEVVPQFFHLYPAILAVGFGLGGLRGETLVTPLLGALGIFAVYLTALRLFPARRQRWIAPVAALFLALNGVQVWFARQSLWEICGEFLLFSGIYGFSLLVRPVAFAQEETPNPPHLPHLQILGAILAGAGFGLVCLAHAQFPFLVWPLLPYFIWLRLTRRWQTAHWVLLLTFGLLFLHSVLHIRIFSLPYWEGIYHNVIQDVRKQLHIFIPGLSVAFFGLILIDAMPQRVRAVESWLKRHWKLAALALAVIASGYLLFSYFIRVYFLSTDGQGNYPPYYWSWQSYIGAPTTEGPERSLLRLGWYFSPLAMLLIFGGVFWLLWKRLDARTGFFMAVSAGVTVFFLDTNYTQEHYIYSLRRYIVMTIPAFTIILVYALFEVLPGWTARLLERLPILRKKQLAVAQTPGGPIAFAVLNQPEPELIPASDSAGTQTTTRLTGNFRRFSLIPSWILTAAILLFLIWTGRTIFTLPQYGAGDGQTGLIAQMDELAQSFQPKDILLFAGDRDPDGKLSTPLTYIYGHPGFVVTESLKNDELAGLLQLWEKQGYTIKALLGPNGGRLFPPGYELKPVREFSVKLRQLEELESQKPNNIQLNSLGYAIYEVRHNPNAGFAASAGTDSPEAPTGWNLKMGQNDYATLVDGFYGAEKDSDGASYRWTVLSGVLRIPCLVPEGSPAKLSLTLSGGLRPAGSTSQVQIYVSNYRYSNETGQWLTLGQVTLGKDPQTFTFDLPAGAPALSCARAETGGKVNSLFLWLWGNQKLTFIPANVGSSPDPRQLSFKVYGVNLTSR